MFDVSKTGTHRFDARLRGVDVTCIVAFNNDGHAEVSIEATASGLAAGLRDISKFAGYCQRTLVLVSSSPETEALASVLASYFGFGLAIVSNGAQREVMPPPDMFRPEDDGPRRAFTRRVLAHLSRD